MIVFLFTVIFSVIEPILFHVNDSDEIIRKRTEALAAGTELEIGNEKIHCRTLLPQFYQSNEFQLVWDRREIVSLIRILKETHLEGLNPLDYHVEAIEALSLATLTPGAKADLDMLCTDGYMLYASHFLNGKVNPETVDSEWKAIRREGNVLVFMNESLKNRKMAASLRELKPQHKAYDHLKASLAKYRKIEAAHGWRVLADGPTLKPGMVDSVRIQELVQRMLISGDLNIQPESAIMYGPELVSAVRNYQKRNGLEVDGNLGKMTIESLNVPVDTRIDQIRVNMERYRWISQELGEHYIVVNIADFQMQVFRKDRLTFEEKVIVGKTFRKTPVFSGRMTYLVFNPYWTVPPTILFNDILPELQKDAGYARTKNIRILSGYESDAKEIDPYTVDWKLYSRGNFPYVLRQDPGPTNALGKMKFMFPNSYNVYIHDTPSRELFNRAERAFSSGCIRLNNPMSFVQYLQQYESRLSPDRVEKLIVDGTEKTIILDKPLDVHILYLTAWSDEHETHFRKDLYARDQPVLKALLSPPPQL